MTAECLYTSVYVHEHIKASLMTVAVTLAIESKVKITNNTLQKY